MTRRQSLFCTAAYQRSFPAGNHVEEIQDRLIRIGLPAEEIQREHAVLVRQRGGDQIVPAEIAHAAHQDTDRACPPDGEPQRRGILRKQKLTESGMQLIEYDEAFFEGILALESVQAVYGDIDKNQTSGLGTLLLEELKMK